MNIKKIIFISLIIRLIIIFISLPVLNFDLKSYLKVGQLTLNKINIYPDVARIHHPYFPFFLYLETLAVYLNKFQINPVFIIKIINNVFDLGNIYLVYLLSKKNKKTALFYALNPITILTSSFHGQFDVIPLFFLLLTVFLINKKPILALLSYSFSIMIKTWPIFFFILFFKELKNKKIFLFVSLFPLFSVFVYSLIFNTDFFTIFLTVLKYRGLFGFFGFGKLISLIFNFFKISPSVSVFFQKILLIVFFTFFLFFSLFFLKRHSLIEKIALLTLFFILFSPFFAIQYFSWPVPFLILSRPKFFTHFLIAATFFINVNYYSWIVPAININGFVNIISLIVWLTVALNFFNLYKLKKTL
ncbi:MAG: hypothetical protein N2482_03440 [Patescibacteria group bacterium]|nr:hypothetical protein [Patescibacteria group bacterium]